MFIVALDALVALVGAVTQLLFPLSRRTLWRAKSPCHSFAASAEALWRSAVALLAVVRTRLEDFFVKTFCFRLLRCVQDTFGGLLRKNLLLQVAEVFLCVYWGLLTI